MKKDEKRKETEKEKRRTTFGSSGKNTKIWSVGSSCFGTKIVRSSPRGTSPCVSRNVSRVASRSSWVSKKER